MGNENLITFKEALVKMSEAARQAREALTPIPVIPTLQCSNGVWEAAIDPVFNPPLHVVSNDPALQAWEKLFQMVGTRGVFSSVMHVPDDGSEERERLEELQAKVKEWQRKFNGDGQC